MSDRLSSQGDSDRRTDTADLEETDAAIYILPRKPRAALAAQLIPAFSRVLDLSIGAPDLATALPEGCMVRTIAPGAPAPLPPSGETDIVTLLGVLESHSGPLDLLRALRSLGCPIVCDYPNAREGVVGPLLREAGFALHSRQPIDGAQSLFKWLPGGDPGQSAAPAARAKKVLVLSYYNSPNFGDRLGYHILNSLMPPGANVTHVPIFPWVKPEGNFDLLILGTGQSLNAATVSRPEIMPLVESIPHSIGIFGTQYRHLYRDRIDPRRLHALLDRLTTWWARYEEDIHAFGRGHANVRHLGDWLISAFPMAQPSVDKNLVIPPDIAKKDIPLDRVIQQIQSYRTVSSSRIHPLLCALTSAEEVAFTEQHEGPDPTRESGKFRSQLFDIFGRTFDEGRLFPVDREAVARYKSRVEANMAVLKTQIFDLLGATLPVG